MPAHPAGRRRRLLLVPAFLAALALPVPGGAVPVQVLKVGALLSLTGEWSTLGVASQAALKIGVAEINSHYRRLGVPRQVRLTIADTKLIPNRALKELKRLAGQGIRTVIGPQSSAEVAAIRAEAARRGVILISQGSTAGSLAIAGDNVFRFCPSDASEGPALSDLMRADGLTAIVILRRADAGNQGLYTASKAAFEQAGGTVAPGMEYGTDVTDFQPVVAETGRQVRDLLATRPAAQVGVLTAAFEEGAALMAAAAADPVLAGVRWYGTDGIAKSQAVLNNPAAASFAAVVGFEAPTVGLDPAAARRWQPLKQAIQKAVGFDPEAFSLAAYDALWVAAQADLGAGSSAPIARRRAAFTSAANSYFGATGWTLLNPAGDRALAAFDFFRVQPAGDGFDWVLSAQYKDGGIARPE